MKNKGFTLVELIVVIVIMGVIAGISIFSYRSLFARSRLEETMNEVRAFYEGVNRRVVTEGYKYLIQIDESDDRLEYISSEGSQRDSLVLREELDLEFSGGVNPIRLTVHVDGFVRDEDDVREFLVIDENTGKSISFYISPLGVLEAKLQ
ncbi:MAG: prepilin-type N-terminal cleavage/methylation domain-containing protein [candidate division WOR-3 bacterium]|jgi:prepilin-type N-terminal cleavage/methylation domain-containing protein